MSKYSISDLVEFRSGVPRWVRHQDYHDRWISWEVYYAHNKPVIDNQYGLIYQLDGKVGDGEDFWGEAKNDVIDVNIFYRVIWNNLYCMVRESDIRCKSI